MGMEKGGKYAIGVGHKQVESWFRKAKPTEEFRADTGLYLRKTEAGAYWHYRFRSPINGKQTRTPLWNDADASGAIGFPQASISEARARASSLRALVATGVDPVLQAKAESRQRDEAQRIAKKELEARLTVRQLFDHWCATELAAKVTPSGDRTGRKDNGAYVRAQFDRHVFSEIGDHYIKEVRKSDFLKVIDRQKVKGKLRTADVLFSTLRQMLNFALDREFIEVNPLASIRKRQIVGKQTERDRYLSEEEIQLLVVAASESKLSEKNQCAMWIMLATGVRIGECMGAIWSDTLPDKTSDARHFLHDLQGRGNKYSEGLKIGIVDLSAGTWYLPATKNNRDHTIHLSAFAKVQFKQLRNHRAKLPNSTELTPWIFPSPRDSSKPVCIKSFGKQLADRQRSPDKRMRGRSNKTESLLLPNGRWTAHDLRRTTGTIMARLGCSGDVIDEALNHKIESRVRRTYIHDRREKEQAIAFDLVGDYLERLLFESS